MAEGGAWSVVTTRLRAELVLEMPAVVDSLQYRPQYRPHPIYVHTHEPTCTLQGAAFPFRPHGHASRQSYCRGKKGACRIEPTERSRMDWKKVPIYSKGHVATSRLAELGFSMIQQPTGLLFDFLWHQHLDIES